MSSELKKRTKERERTAQKAAKAAAAPPVAQKKTSAAAAEDELDPSVSYFPSFHRNKLIDQAFYENRYRTIKALRGHETKDPYPHKFHVSHGIPKFIEEYGAEGKLNNGDVVKDIKPVS